MLSMKGLLLVLVMFFMLSFFFGFFFVLGGVSVDFDSYIVYVWFLDKGFYDKLGIKIWEGVKCGMFGYGGFYYK